MTTAEQPPGRRVAGAFEDYVRAELGALVRFAYLMGGDRGRAEDAVQSALEKAYPRWSGLRDPDAYVKRSIVNATRDGWRRHGRWERLVGEPPEVTAVDGAAGELSGAHHLAGSIRALPAGQRAVLVLRYWEDLSEQRTAEVLGISVGTVKSQSHKALKALRAVIDMQERVEGNSP